jgi:hypothetical protein
MMPRLRVFPIAQEMVYYRHHFVEFDCDRPELDFALAVPNVERLEEIIDNQGYFPRYGTKLPFHFWPIRSPTFTPFSIAS